MNPGSKGPDLGLLSLGFNGTQAVDLDPQIETSLFRFEALGPKLFVDNHQDVGWSSFMCLSDLRVVQTPEYEFIYV